VLSAHQVWGAFNRGGIRASQRLQELHQVGFFARRQDQRPAYKVASIVEFSVYCLLQRCYTSIVHIGCRQFDVAQARGSEVSNVRWTECDGEAAEFRDIPIRQYHSINGNSGLASCDHSLGQFW
jgi:hypothetical protein